jgi:hypothetical protein
MTKIDRAVKKSISRESRKRDDRNGVIEMK